MYKKILKSLALALAILVMASSTIAFADDEFVVGYDFGGNACPYCAKIAGYIEQYAEEAGIKVILTTCDFDALTQINNAESMIAQGAKVVGAIFCDKDACMPIADLCKAEDITCLATLCPLTDEANGYENYIFLGSENYDGGYKQGEWLAEYTGWKEGDDALRIWYLDDHAGDQAGADRKAGFEGALKDLGVNYDIVACEFSNYSMDDGVIIMENWMQVYDDIDIVVSGADLAVLGAITAYEAGGRDVEAVTWIGLDGQDAALESVTEGKMDMTMLQDAETQAKEFIKLCCQIRDGEVKPSEVEDIYIPFVPIDATNISDFLK